MGMLFHPRTHWLTLVCFGIGTVFLATDFYSLARPAIVDKLPRNFFVVANYGEAGLWFLLGMYCLVASLRNDESRTFLLISGISLVAFGASDICEVQTGAWWTPWWLLLWKCACVLMVSGAVVGLFRIRRLQNKRT
jgi:hypothetical protein